MNPLVGYREGPKLSDGNRLLRAAFPGLPVPCFEFLQFAVLVLRQLLIDGFHQFLGAVGGEAGQDGGAVAPELGVRGALVAATRDGQTRELSAELFVSPAKRDRLASERQRGENYRS